MIRIAIQKKGRISDDSIGLLKKCGLGFSDSSRTLIAPCSNFDAEILYLRDDDIPQYVEDGIADIGIVGENVLEEYEKNVNTLKKLGFSKCRLSLAVPKSVDYNGPDYFNGKQIATSYSNILKKFLNKHNVDARLHHLSGSVEIAPGIGLADGIFDIVSTGSTLLANGLKEVEVVMRSEAIFVGNRDLNEEKQSLVDKLLFRIEAVERAKAYRYILLNAPNENIEKIIDTLPGMKSPTVLPLAQEGWSSVHSVVLEKEFWKIVDELKAWGAEGLLITPIEKMVM